MAEARDLQCFSYVVENLENRTIPSAHGAIRLVIQKPTPRGHQSKRIPSWMSKHLIFCSLLQRLHDDHRFSHDPFCPLAEFKALLEKAKRQTIREISRKTPESIGAQLLIDSTALHACRNRHRGTLMRCCEAWKPIEDCFHTSSFECVLLSSDSAKTLHILFVKLLRNANLRSRISLGHRQKKTML